MPRMRPPSATRRPPRPWPWLVPGLALYAAALALPAVLEPGKLGESRSVAGWQLALMGALGWASAFDPDIDLRWLLVREVGWCANPAFWAGAWSLGRGRWRGAVSWGVAGLALGGHAGWLLAGRAGAGLSWGYYVWLSSMAWLVAAGWVLRPRTRAAAEPGPAADPRRPSSSGRV